jgi:fructosamine-3-kinase
MFRSEARGLSWLAEAKALHVPGVLGVSERALVLEHLEPGRPGRDFDERLGRGLAALHRMGAPGFGLDHDNFIGTLPQANAKASAPVWAAFYRERRLLPQVKLAVDGGFVSPRMRRALSTLVDQLEERVGPPEPAARLHGDLWGGNLVCAAPAEPCLIDPAVYGGHREVDLAMMRLFGGFSARVFAAYEEVTPLAPEAEERFPLYQLYYLLVHVNLFGVGYLGQLDAVLSRLGVS